ncbi:hypothetical protein Scep_017002 [Stephania cephalantha]|uniref:Uncharacterized protein n=1 Tax=Stephania cephalantha TaxID=152367 RepID=A0AAP0INS2_9MAGN
MVGKGYAPPTDSSNYRSAKIEASGGQAITFGGDVSKEEDVESMIKAFDDGETFQWSKVTSSIYNLILGKIYCGHYGTMHIKGNREYSCKLKFKERVHDRPKSSSAFVKLLYALNVPRDTNWQVLTNGIEVKLQRNALSVLEPPTGLEDDDDLECENAHFNVSDMIHMMDRVVKLIKEKEMLKESKSKSDELIKVCILFVFPINHMNFEQAISSHVSIDSLTSLSQILWNLLIFKDEAYSDYLHGIEDSNVHQLDNVCIYAGIVTVEGITYVLDVHASLFVEGITVVQNSIFV